MSTETRRLAAIMFTDIVDFSRQMGTDEARTLRLLDVHNQLIHQAVTTHHGTVIKTIGDGVNIAARLQELTEPDTICLSQKVYEEVAKKVDLGTLVSLGRPKLKNIAERFAVYALLSALPQGFWQTLQVQRLKLSRRISTAQRAVAMGLILIVGTAVAIRHLPSFFGHVLQLLIARVRPESQIRSDSQRGQSRGHA